MTKTSLELEDLEKGAVSNATEQDENDGAVEHGMKNGGTEGIDSSGDVGVPGTQSVIDTENKDTHQSIQVTNAEQIELNIKEVQPEVEKPQAHILRRMLCGYFKKFTGVKGHKNPYQRPTIPFMFVTFIASFIAISILGVLHYYAIIDQLPHANPNVQLQVVAMLVGSFGASAVLVYGEIKSPLAQPRNLVGGHFVSALVGVIWKVILIQIPLGNWFYPWFCGLAVASAVVAMQITRTTHPPGRGATALIAVMSPLFPWYGFQYLFVPILSGSLIMLIVALLVDNLKPESRYPLYWI
ncbi:transmembrane protein [Acrasis kona]|uniref:Transmembrane protein n=1 Tax=Acrasis kona TaxID=1008807 RepID=A0AAW2ZMN0_9EUKA